jgi:hypothetical protein
MRLCGVMSSCSTLVQQRPSCHVQRLGPRMNGLGIHNPQVGAESHFTVTGDGYACTYSYSLYPNCTAYV